MSVLRGPDGTFYDVPDDQLTSYKVPPEKVRETLEKAGVPAAAGQMGPGGGGGGPPGMGMHGGPVVIQIYPPPMGGPAPGPGGGPAPDGGGGPGGQGQVDPYWWWTRYWWTRYYYYY
jgi:hypothetical protein